MKKVQEHWLRYVIVTVLIAFVGVSVGKVTIGFLASMILMLVSGIYPALNDGIIAVITDNIGFFMVLLLLELYVHKKEKKSVGKLWLSGSKHKVWEFLVGVVVGLLLCVASVTVAIALTDWNLIFQSVDFLVIGLVLLSCIIQASIEEILFRGYLLRGLQKKYSVGFSIVVSGIVFSVTHIMNPGITILAIINITLIGIALSYLAVRWNSLFLVMGIHFMWNFTEEVIFGTPNSGIVFPKAIFTLVGEENSLFYNPQFGIEATVQTLIFWGVLLLFSWKMGSRKE